MIITGRHMSGCYTCYKIKMDCITEKITNRKNYQRGSNEKDGDRQRNSETIQDQEIAISRTSYTT